MARQLTAQIARREPVTEEQAMALAAAVLTSDPVRLASAVLAAPPEFRAARVLDLIEHLSGARAQSEQQGASRRRS